MIVEIDGNLNFFVKNEELFMVLGTPHDVMIDITPRTIVSSGFGQIQSELTLIVRG